MSESFDSANAAKRHEMLSDVAEAAAKMLIEKHGIDQDVAIEVGNGVADLLASRWRGQQIYMVSDRGFQLSRRDWEIFERMRRGNANDLAAEYGISFVRIHQIYKRCLAEARRRIQPGLFGEAESADNGDGVDP